jgi:hypothetical protein
MSIEPPVDGDLPEISSQASDALASWRRVLDQTKGDKRWNFQRACDELLHLAEGHADPAARQEIVDTLYDIAAAAGINNDDAQAIMAAALHLPRFNGNTLNDNLLDEPGLEHQTPGPVIKSSREFVAGFVPPDYVVAGLLQRRFFYSLTGQTGAGKTAIMLLLAACAALVRPFAGRETKRLRVLYLAAENADDVRMRWIALAQQMDFDINAIEVFFVEGRFSISRSLSQLCAEAERHGGDFGLVIIDTGPTFFEGKEENENKQLGDHARMLRSLIDKIPGDPCVIANCHPVKNATENQLIPRGGGAFLAEVDGNLTAAKNDSTVELHWQGRFRGPDFAPMHFLIRTVTHQDLKDSDGRLIPTVICEHISEQTKEDLAKAARQDEDAVLKLISKTPQISFAAIASIMGWKLYSGEPNKSRAVRCVKTLLDSKIIKKARTGHVLTDEGKKILKDDKTQKARSKPPVFSTLREDA